MMLNVLIDKISSRYFFFYVLILFSLSKLLPILSETNKLTYLVFFISIFVFIFRIINIIFIKRKISINLLKVFTMALFCFAILSYLIDANFTIQGLCNGREYITLATIFINFVVAFSFDKNDKIVNKIEFINNVSLIVLIFSFIYVFPNTIYSILTHNMRIWGFAVSVATYSDFLVIAFSCSLYLLLNSNIKYMRFISFINLFLQIIMLIFAQQRNAFLGFFIGVIFSIVIMFLCNKYSSLIEFLKKNTKLIFILFSFFIIMLLLIFKFIPLSVLFSKIRNMNTSGRAEIWNISNSIFIENNVFFGFGGGISAKVNEYVLIHPDVYINPTYKSFIVLGWAHSLYLAFLYDFGIIGLLWLLIILFCVVLNYIRFINKNKNNEKYFNIMILMTFCIVPPIIMGIFNENMLINIYNLPNIMFIIFASFLGDEMVIKEISFNSKKN